MYAVVTEVTYAPGQWTAGQAQLAEYRALRAQTPGFRGSRELDTGDERHLVLTCWESAAHSPHSPAGTMPPDAARSALRAAGERLVAPLFAAPAQLLGMGEVVGHTVTPGDAPGYGYYAERLWHPGGWDAGQALREEWWALLAQQPGFRERITIAADAGRYLTLTCWERAGQQEVASDAVTTARLAIPSAFAATPTGWAKSSAVVYDSLTARA